MLKIRSIKTILFAMFSMLALASCSENDTPNDKPNDTPSNNPGDNSGKADEEGPDFLVMFYGVGGRNLDAGIMSNIYQALDTGSSNNVKMTVQYKLSKDLQEVFPEFDGTRRLDLDDNQHLVGKMSEMFPTIPYMTNKDQFDDFISQLKSECLADSKYDMAKGDALADFITWSMKKHPSAKRTILVLNDHGSGWQIKNDGKPDYTRAILQDDNTDTLMSLESVVEGVKNSSAGKVDLLYTDACLMSTYENLYGYAKCIKYLLASVEITPGSGGNYTFLLNNLKTCGTSDAALESMLHKYADYLVSNNWWMNKDFIDRGLGGEYHDIALYDLSKLNTLTSVLKKTVDTLVEKFGSEESVEPTSTDVPFGEHFSGYINQTFTNCQIANHSDRFPIDYIPETIVDYYLADYTSLNYLCIDDYNANMKELLFWLKYTYTENAKAAQESFPDDWAYLKYYIIYYSTPSFSLTDILRLLDNSLTQAGAKNNPFKSLRAELLAALKEVGYIKCTIGDEKPGIDQAYELCSPGINIVPFNDSYYDETSNNFLSEVPTYQEAMRIYQQTDFDKQVGWSRMLQLITIFPDVFSNPMRKFVE